MNDIAQDSAAFDPQSRGQTVLVVDDDPINLDTITDHLVGHGIEISIAQNGESGLERARLIRPDLILLDIVMPGIDGFETCRRLKSDPVTRDIPVIFMTALAETEHKVEGFRVGAVDYITKPIQEQEVLARVMTHLRLHELTKGLEQKVRARTDELATTNRQLEREIAEHARAETALRESEEKYRNLVEQANDGIVIVQDTLLKYVNRRGVKMIGYPIKELVGKPFANYIHPDELAQVAGYYERRMAGTAIPSIYESAIRHKDGHRVDVEFNIRITLYQGRPAELVVIRDVTERKQLIAQIQEQARRMQQIVDTTPEGMLLLDTGGRIVLINPVARNHLDALAGARAGDTLTRLGDRPLAELLTPPPRGLWHEVTANQQSFQIIAQPIETGPTPGGTSPEPAQGWLVVIRDITQQREYDQRIQQQERLAAVGQLAAGIAHDFNNIMATIVLYAQMTMRTPDISDRIRKRMATIDRQAQHATNLIRQILDFGRRAALERQLVDLLSLVKEQIQLLKRTLPESIEIKLTYQRGEYIVNADLTSMQQMMTNLAINARDAMPQGGRFHVEMMRIQIEEHQAAPLPEMENGEWLQMIVSDTGTGISPDALPHIFDPFFTTKGPGKGSGLGLSQVHGIVGQHEGHITVKTQPERGTTFTIYLPALPIHPIKAPDSDLLDELSSLPKGQGETILLVEDNASTRQALMESLEQLNYHILEARNGREALEILEQGEKEIALVLSDVIMPEMGGITLLHTLKQKGIDVGMVMLTGHPLQDELEGLRAQGMIDWLPKPPGVAKLAKVVARALKGIKD